MLLIISKGGVYCAVGKIVTVSVVTVKLVEELAREVGQEGWLGKEG